MRRVATLLRPIAQLGLAQAARGQPAAWGTATAPLPACVALQSRCYGSAATFRARVCDVKPATLESQCPADDVADGEQHSIRHFLLKLGGFYSKESEIMRGALGLYAAAVENAENPDLRAALGLPEGASGAPASFAATHSMLCLHIFLLLSRLRLEGDACEDLSQKLYDDFQDDVEMRVHAEGVKVRVSSHLKELEKNFYGACESYEKALKGEGELVDALLRNLYAGDVAQRPNADTLSRYMLRELACLKLTPTPALMAGRVAFSKDLA